MGASLQCRTEDIVHYLDELLTVLVWQSAQVSWEAGGTDILHWSKSRSATSSSIDSYTLPTGTSSPGREGYLAS